MSALTIYKASAGSGKTYRLVMEYLKLLVETPMNYAHILAVTFTNKATTEMKERVIRNLHEIANHKNQSLLDDLIRESGKAEPVVLERTQKALSLILHNYDRFSISTIDRFFQRVLRSFARESGLMGTYEVQLDQDTVLDEAIDRLLLDVENDKSLRKWLLTMAENQMAEGKNWQVRNNIFNLGKQLQNEDFNKYLQDFLKEGTERVRLNALNEKLNTTIHSFIQTLKKKADDALAIIAEQQLELADFKGGSRSFSLYFLYWSQGRHDKLEPTDTLLAAVDDEEKWYTKISKKANDIKACFQTGLNTKLKDILQFLDEKKPEYFAAVAIRKHAYSLGLLASLSKKVREIGQESNSILLSEGNNLLHGIIANNDAPFIYEKTGNYYHHFMIDEFQDTSTKQWDNFRPLIANSLAENKKNLVVGDVKQAIYRWRNSDWRILEQQIRSDFAHYQQEEKQLENNWRSSQNIVHFNNRFFKWGAAALQNYFNEKIGEDKDEEYKKVILHAFSDVEQKSKNTEESGLISLKFLPDDKDLYEQLTIDALIGAVKQCQDKGYRAGDIAVLVRKNKQGKRVAAAFLKEKEKDDSYNFEVISDDTLFIQSSAAVRFLANMLIFITTPYDKVMKAAALYEFANKLLPALQQQNLSPPRIIREGQSELSMDAGDQENSILPEEVRRDYFSFFDSDKRVLIEQWYHLPIGSLVEELIARYHLDKISGEQASIQAFRDLLADFSRRESGNLHAFVAWWQQHGSSVKVQTTGERDALRIMTIHKAKGLEFPLVMLPFCDWDFQANAKSIIWSKTDRTPFNEFPVLPLTCTQELGKSLFKKEYQKENLLSYIDNLNLLYVALTRPVKGLFLFTKDKPKPDSSVAGLLNQIKDGNLFKEIPQQILDDELSLGDLPKRKYEETVHNEIKLSGTVSRNKKIGESLRIRSRSMNFLDDESSPIKIRINKGKLMHELLAEIDRVEDAEGAIDLLVMEGKIEAGEVNAYRQELDSLLANPLSSEWFNGSYKVLNERTIIMPVFRLYRPDRVMIRGDEVLVVDYKSTAMQQLSHVRQVKSYTEHIRNMGYKKVKGYIWYLKSNEVVKVEEN